MRSSSPAPWKSGAAAQGGRRVDDDLLDLVGLADELAPHRQQRRDAPETCGAAMLVPVSST